ncbi:hypothetical protein AB3S75_047600 [Citrus x aurantiifolia]
MKNSAGLGPIIRNVDGEIMTAVKQHPFKLALALSRSTSMYDNKKNHKDHLYIHIQPFYHACASYSCYVAHHITLYKNKIPSLQNTILPFSSKHEIFLPHLIHLQHQKSRRQGLRWDARAIAPPPLPCYCTIISSPRDIRTIILASSHFIFTTRIIKQKCWSTSFPSQALEPRFDVRTYTLF